MPGPHTEETQVFLASQLLGKDQVKSFIPIDWTQIAPTPVEPQDTLVKALQYCGVTIQNTYFSPTEIEAICPEPLTNIEPLKQFFLNNSITQTDFIDADQLRYGDPYSSYLEQYELTMFKVNLSFTERKTTTGKAVFCITECEYFDPEDHYSSVIHLHKFQDGSFVRIGLFTNRALLGFWLTNPQDYPVTLKNTLPIASPTISPQIQYESAMQLLAQMNVRSTQLIYHFISRMLAKKSDIDLNFLTRIIRVIINESRKHTDAYDQVLIELEKQYTAAYKIVPLSTAIIPMILGILFGASLFFSPFTVGALALAALGLITCIMISAVVTTVAAYCAYTIWNENRYLAPLHQEMVNYKQSLRMHKPTPEVPKIKEPTKNTTAIPVKSCLKKKEAGNSSSSHKMVRHSKIATVGTSFSTHYCHGTRIDDDTVIFTQKLIS